MGIPSRPRMLSRIRGHVRDSAAALVRLTTAPAQSMESRLHALGRRLARLFRRRPPATKPTGRGVLAPAPVRTTARALLEALSPEATDEFLGLLGSPSTNAAALGLLLNHEHPICAVLRFELGLKLSVNEVEQIVRAPLAAASDNRQLIQQAAGRCVASLLNVESDRDRILATLRHAVESKAPHAVYAAQWLLDAGELPSLEILEAGLRALKYRDSAPAAASMINRLATGPDWRPRVIHGLRACDDERQGALAALLLLELGEPPDQAIFQALAGDPNDEALQALDRFLENSATAKPCEDALIRFNRTQERVAGSLVPLLLLERGLQPTGAWLSSLAALAYLSWPGCAQAELRARRLLNELLKEPTARERAIHELSNARAHGRPPLEQLGLLARLTGSIDDEGLRQFEQELNAAGGPGRISQAPTILAELVSDDRVGERVTRMLRAVDGSPVAAHLLLASGESPTERIVAGMMLGSEREFRAFLQKHPSARATARALIGPKMFAYERAPSIVRALLDAGEPLTEALVEQLIHGFRTEAVSWSAKVRLTSLLLAPATAQLTAAALRRWQGHNWRGAPCTLLLAGALGPLFDPVDGLADCGDRRVRRLVLGLVREAPEAQLARIRGELLSDRGVEYRARVAAVLLDAAEEYSEDILDALLECLAEASWPPPEVTTALARGLESAANSTEVSKALRLALIDERATLRSRAAAIFLRAGASGPDSPLFDWLLSSPGDAIHAIEELAANPATRETTLQAVREYLAHELNPRLADIVLQYANACDEPVIRSLLRQCDYWRRETLLKLLRDEQCGPVTRECLRSALAGPDEEIASAAAMVLFSSGERDEAVMVGLSAWASDAAVQTALRAAFADEERKSAVSEALARGTSGGKRAMHGSEADTWEAQFACAYLLLHGGFPLDDAAGRILAFGLSYPLRAAQEVFALARERAALRQLLLPELEKLLSDFSKGPNAATLMIELGVELDETLCGTIRRGLALGRWGRGDWIPSPRSTLERLLREPQTANMVRGSLRAGMTLIREPSSEAAICALILLAAEEAPTEAMIKALLHNWRREDWALEARDALVELVAVGTVLGGATIPKFILHGVSNRQEARSGLGLLLSEERAAAVTRAALLDESSDPDSEIRAMCADFLKSSR